MTVGAVLLLRNSTADGTLSSNPSLGLRQFLGAPPALWDVLGEPVLHRMVESLRRANVGPIALVTDDALKNHAVIRDIAHWHVEVMAASAGDLQSVFATAAARVGGEGTRRVLVLDGSVYAELAVSELVIWQRDTRQEATFLVDGEGVLLPMALMQGAQTDRVWPVLANCHNPLPAASQYQHRGYVNRLESVAHLRSLARDAFQHKCHIRPNGAEIRAGVWIADSARIHPHARIAGPAYVGPYTRLRPGALISEHSAIERCCEVDRGTVVEESTILPYTYLGVCLDLAQAVVKQNRLADLKRGCVLDVSDASIAASRVAAPRLLPSLVALKSGSVVGMRARLRGLLSRASAPAPSTRVSYEKPAAGWTNLQPIPGTTEPRSS